MPVAIKDRLSKLSLFARQSLAYLPFSFQVRKLLDYFHPWFALNLGLYRKRTEALMTSAAKQHLLRTSPGQA